jgi:hypothetical protein
VRLHAERERIEFDPVTLAKTGASSVAAMKLGSPVIFWLRVLWQRSAFVAVVTAFHVMNWVLLNVQFLFMPAVFVTFFDLSAFARRIAPWLASPRAGARPSPAAS